MFTGRINDTAAEILQSSALLLMSALNVKILRPFDGADACTKIPISGDAASLPIHRTRLVIFSRPCRSDGDE